MTEKTTDKQEQPLLNKKAKKRPKKVDVEKQAAALRKNLKRRKEKPDS